MLGRHQIADAQEALSPRLFDMEWCCPVQIGSVWYSGPIDDPVGYITSTTKEGAERQRAKIRRRVEAGARRLIWC